MLLRNGFQIGLSGADESCDYITFSGRKADWNLRAMKSPDEKGCAERFCSREHPELTKLTKMREDSPVDILAESADGTARPLNLQVTELWPEEFLKEFGQQRRVDRKISWGELVNFIRTSVQQKINKKSSSKDVILLVDTKPADLPQQCLLRIDSDEALKQDIAALSNFLEIWLVDSNGTVQLK